ncbi:MAG: rhomboid family intramembrane serine protease [Bdellovibrionales bacterium]|nr:rhomboid family intramembrane serine protease [Bdellovibrionales bacterium]
MILMIILLNVIVFLMWTLAPAFSLQEFMVTHFLTSPLHMEEGAYWTLLTSVFSHNMFFHILINMFVLNSFGPVLLYVMGKTRFLIFYLVAGLAGSIGHCMTAYYFIGDPQSMALGASGAIAGLIALFSFMYPKQILLLMGFIPVPAFLGIVAIIGIDVWGLMTQIQGGGLPIGHGAHLGGAFLGILYYFLVIRPKMKRYA